VRSVKELNGLMDDVIWVYVCECLSFVVLFVFDV